MIEIFVEVVLIFLLLRALRRLKRRRFLRAVEKLSLGLPLRERVQRARLK